ncbi:cytochrome P450 [Flagelloscypha sp. PMI_526]|nr:cytochrome P450 [Flagelloscypha sp. PMI_526]
MSLSSQFLFRSCCSLAFYSSYLVLAVVAIHILGYFYDPYNLRKYPGPFFARFSYFWLASVARQGKRSEVVHSLHNKYGPVVRISPTQISLADPSALPIVYAHGNGSLKSDFYDAFVSIRTGIFNTRNRNEHTRKRKLISHVFSSKNVLQFEPHILNYVHRLTTRWDGFLAQPEGARGDDGEGWNAADGMVWLDLIPWLNYLAFDIIGDLAFGSPFGMIEAGKDQAMAPIVTGDKGVKSALNYDDKIEYKSIPAIKILTGRGDYSASIGCFPPWMRPWVKRFVPWYRRGAGDVENLAGIAVAKVATRLRRRQRSDSSILAEQGGMEGKERTDLLSKLQFGKDENGKRLSPEEVTAEALTLLIAGSDTTANSLCAVLYYLCKHTRTQHRLQEELDAVFGSPSLAASCPSTYTQHNLRDIPLLTNCIFESLRVHSTSSLGLPRTAPPGGLDLLGQHFKEGTVLSVPSYSIHRDVETWGEDADEWRVERWEEGGPEAAKKREAAWNGFSTGPRACVGKNLALLELQDVVASLLHQFEFILEDPSRTLDTREGFLRKPLACRVGVRRRL